MYSNKMRPRIIKQDYERIRLFEDGESKTLIGYKDWHAFISHNLGISWKQIDLFLGSYFEVLYYGNNSMIISEPGEGPVYLLDGRGNVIKECVYKELNLNQECYKASVHPNNSNAILVHDIVYQGVYGDDVCCNYTADGGASEWELLEGFSGDACGTISGGFGTFYDEAPSYEFITGGAPDLIYEYDIQYGGYTAYTLDIFSGSPPKLTYFPFVVHQTQDIFFANKNRKELHVSKDGVNFEQIEFPIHSSPWKHKNLVDGFIETSDREENTRRFKGSLFLQRHYKIEDDPSGRKLPGYTLFRYDVQHKEIKFMLDYCDDYLVVSAEEGIIIANYITNPQGYVDHEEKPNIRTVVTYNDGIDWEPMTGPSGAEFNVAIADSLGRSFGDTPSKSSMMIVCGKEGPLENYREFNSNRDFTSSLSTYMTKDTGRSWRKINDDTMNCSIGGNDDIIILSRGDKEHILYSLDGGMKWQKRTIGKVDQNCWNSSSNSNSKRFLLGTCSISFDPADQLEQSYL